jgi:hypothetical protein
MKAQITAGAMAVILTAGLGLSSAAAQVPAETEQVLAMVTAVEQRMERGEFTEAARLEAARLHIALAETYGEGTPEAVESLRTAAFYIGMSNSRWSSRLLANAADQALSYGDIDTAAHSLLDAFCSFGHSKKTFSEAEAEELHSYINRATRLAQSPLLTEAQRHAILVRVDSK